MSGIVKREIFATSEIRDYLRWPLKSLELDGVISVIDSELIDVSPYLSIHFARSEHGQRAIWPIVSHSKYRERLLTTPANTLKDEIKEKVISGIQEILNSLSWQGSGLVRFNDLGELLMSFVVASEKVCGRLTHRLRASLKMRCDLLSIYPLVIFLCAMRVG